MPSSRSHSSKSSSSGKKSSRSKSVEKKQNRDRKRSRSNSSPKRRRSPSNQRRRRSPQNQRRRSPRKYQQSIPKSNKLFVTNIDSKYVTQQVKQGLEKQFGRFGEIKEISVKTSRGSANSYAFITFNNEDDAEKALNEMKGGQFKGRELKVEFGRGERKEEDRRSDKCFICHRQGHFAKDCRYRERSRDRYESRDYGRRRRHSRSSSRSPRRKRSYERDSYRRRDDRDRDYRRRDDRERDYRRRDDRERY